MIKVGWITFLLSSCILIDVINKNLLFNGNISTNLFLIKAVILIVFLSRQINLHAIIFVLLLFFVTSMYSLVIVNENINFELYILYRFTIVCALFVLLFNRLLIMDIHAIKKQFEFVIKVFQLNIVFVFLGMFFNIRLFAMDENMYREGYTGILPFSGNEVNYFFFTVLIYLYYQYSNSSSNSSDFKSYRRMLIIYSIMGVMSGLKLSMFLSLLLLFLLRPFLVLLVSCIAIMILRDSLQGLYLITQFARRGFFDWLTSGRLPRLLESSFSENFLLGERRFIQLEMDHLSLIYSYGFLGIILICIWKYFLYVAWRRSTEAFVLLFAVFAGTFVAGHLFTSVFALPWVAIGFVLLLHREKVNFNVGSLERK